MCAHALFEAVADRADLELWAFDRFEVAFDFFELFVGAHDLRSRELRDGDAGAEDVEPVEGGLVRDLLESAGERERLLADLDREVLLDAVAVDGGADRERDLGGAGERARAHTLADRLERLLGRLQEVFAFAASFRADEGVAADGEPLAGVVGRADLGEVGAVEQRELERRRRGRAS